MSDTFPWAQLITSIVAAAALIISIYGLKYSYEANTLSEKALLQSENIFIEKNRPRLQLTPVKVKGISLRATQLEKKIIFHVDINIKNAGEFTANNINILDSWIMTINEIELKPDSITPLTDSLSLGHNQNFHINRYFTYTGDNAETIKKIMILWNNEDVFVTGDLIVKYSDSSSKLDYKVSASYKLSRLKDVILKNFDN